MQHSNADRSFASTSALGAYLRELRRFAGLRQQDVIEQLRAQGYKPYIKDLWTWEKGVHVPTSRMLAALTELLGGSPIHTANLLQYDAQHNPLIRAALASGENSQWLTLTQSSIDYGFQVARQRHLERMNERAGTDSSEVPHFVVDEVRGVLDILYTHRPDQIRVWLQFGRFLISLQTSS